MYTQQQQQQQQSFHSVGSGLCTAVSHGIDARRWSVGPEGRESRCSLVDEPNRARIIHLNVTTAGASYSVSVVASQFNVKWFVVQI